MSKLNLRDLIAVAFFVALTSVGAWISFPLPFSPVPIAFANGMAVLSGAILGKRLGPLSQAVYVLMGLVGIPVFAQFSAGPGVVAGPTGGYLAGYILAAFVTGLLVEHLPRVNLTVRFALALSAGMVVVYLPGIPWLAHVTGMNIPTALVKGCYPYLPGDIFKTIIGVILCRSLLSQLPHIWKWNAAGKLVRQTEAN